MVDFRINYTLALARLGNLASGGGVLLFWQSIEMSIYF